MSETEALISALTGVIERNTEAMQKNAEANHKMAEEVRHLRATIQGAQRKIGGELGPVIDQSKEAHAALAREAAAVVASKRGQSG